MHPECKLLMSRVHVNIKYLTPCISPRTKYQTSIGIAILYIRRDHAERQQLSGKSTIIKKYINNISNQIFCSGVSRSSALCNSLEYFQSYYLKIYFLLRLYKSHLIEICSHVCFSHPCFLGQVIQKAKFIKYPFPETLMHFIFQQQLKLQRHRRDLKRVQGNTWCLFLPAC